MPDIQNSFVYCHYIRQIAFHIMKVQDELLAPYNITSQQARVLGFIRMCHEQHGIVCQRDLEAGFGLQSSSITSLIKGLEKRGYVQREPGAQDARTKLLSLTNKGKEFHDTFMQIFQNTESKIVEGMTLGERAILLELLRKAAQNLNKPFNSRDFLLQNEQG